ncbi:MAG: hypothetical protein AAF354_12915 [Pseudomonadota bacterium]
MAFFAWILVPLAVWGAISYWGTPHVVVTYRYIGPSYLPPAERRYIDCTYVGWRGTLTVPAIDEHRPWLRLFKAGD